MAGIAGVVRDSSGAVVPNARVVVSNDGKGIVRNLLTNEVGVFTAPALMPASGYRVVVDATGFATYEVNDLQLPVGANLNLNVSLAIARMIIDVDLTAEGGIVEDTKSGVSQVIGTREIVDLPING